MHRESDKLQFVVGSSRTEGSRIDKLKFVDIRAEPLP
jgi:hypothetical protein